MMWKVKITTNSKFGTDFTSYYESWADVLAYLDRNEISTNHSFTIKYISK